MDTVVYYALSALAVLIVLTIHEFSHGYAAYKLGDNTAKYMGRLTLNPIKHIDPFGTVCMILFHFGWAKPVPIDPRNFKNPKKGFAISALAGPLANLITAFFMGFLYLSLATVFSKITFTSNFIFVLCQNALLFINIFYFTNLGLAVFNLIPIPPLDGSRILAVILPPKAYFGLMKYEKQIYIGLLIWLLAGSYISGFLLSFSFITSNPPLAFVARYISLPNIISAIINFVSSGILGFWRLLPFLN